VAARGRRPSGSARLLVLLGILTVLGVTFAAGVYTGHIWAVRSLVVANRVPEPEPRRGPGRGGRMPDLPAPRLTFYQELTAPLTAPPPPPKPAKTSPPPLVTLPPAATAASAPRPGEQSDLLAAASRTPAPRPAAREAAAGTGSAPGPAEPPAAPRGAPGAARFTVQVGAYRVRPPADALRASLASAGHDVRVVEADANGPVYRVQIGEFATRDEARAAAARLAGAPVTPFVTTR
jgi:cell division protein FtsN